MPAGHTQEEGVTPDPDPTPDPTPGPEPTPEPAPPPDPKPDLTDADRAALETVVEKERKARRDAEKAAREAQAKLDAIQAEQLSETEKLQKEAEDGRKAHEEGIRLAREAKLITALTDHGLIGGKAKAALRLLTAVEYDDEHEPTNLDAAITAAKATYGDDVFTPASTRPVPPAINPGDPPPTPTPELSAEELEAAKEGGIPPERYAALKGVRTYEDWVALQQK